MSATAEKHGSDVAINSRIERSPTCSSPCRRSTCRANSGSAWALVLLFGRDHGHATTAYSRPMRSRAPAFPRNEFGDSPNRCAEPASVKPFAAPPCQQPKRSRRAEDTGPLIVGLVRLAMTHRIACHSPLVEVLGSLPLDRRGNRDHHSPIACKLPSSHGEPRPSRLFVRLPQCVARGFNLDQLPRSRTPGGGNR